MASNKIGSDPRLPTVGSAGYAERLSTRLYELFREHARAINGLRNEASSVPTTGTWAKGDFVWNTSPAEAGMSLSKYVIIGWTCTVGGAPGTWLPARTLTGN